MLRVWLVVVTHCCTIMESGLSTVVASDSEPATAGGGAWRQWQDWSYTDYEAGNNGSHTGPCGEAGWHPLRGLWDDDIQAWQGGRNAPGGEREDLADAMENQTWPRETQAPSEAPTRATASTEAACTIPWEKECQLLPPPPPPPEPLRPPPNEPNRALPSAPPPPSPNNPYSYPSQLRHLVVDRKAEKDVRANDEAVAKKRLAEEMHKARTWEQYPWSTQWQADSGHWRPPGADSAAGFDIHEAATGKSEGDYTKLRKLTSLTAAAVEQWEVDIRRWQITTDIEHKKWGFEAVDSLPDEQRKLFVGVPDAELEGTDGMKNVIDRIRLLIGRRPNQERKRILREVHANSQRRHGENLVQYIIRRGEEVQRAKCEGCNIPVDLEASWLEEGARLTSYQMELLKVITHDNMDPDQVREALFILDSGNRNATSSQIYGSDAGSVRHAATWHF